MQNYTGKYTEIQKEPAPGIAYSFDPLLNSLLAAV